MQQTCVHIVVFPSCQCLRLSSNFTDRVYLSTLAVIVAVPINCKRIIEG
jgi:hypothetical protein